MDSKTTRQRDIYQIRIKGRLDRRFADWFECLTIISLEKSETLLEGVFADQPALRGCLEQLWNLNFTILSVERIDHETRS